MLKNAHSRRPALAFSFLLMCGLSACSTAPGPAVDTDAAVVDSAKPSVDPTQPQVTIPTASPSPANDLPPLLSLPISSADGYKAVINITQWEEVEMYDTSACPAIYFDPKRFISRAVVIGGYIDYPVVSGFTWVRPIELRARTQGVSSVLETMDPVMGAVCSTPVSSPNSASSLPNLEDVAWVAPPESDFEMTIVYGSPISPNFPEGRFGEVGPITQYLTIPSVKADCAAANVNGFTSIDYGYCVVSREAFTP